MVRPVPDGIRPPPAGCRVIVEGQPDGFTITVPPHGLVRGGGCGLVFFTLLWIGCTIFVTASCYDHAPTSGGVPSPFARYMAPIVSWFLSIGLVLAMVNLGRRRAVLTVTEDRLRIQEIRPFLRPRGGEWKRSQLFAICAGPTPTRGVSRNLEIYPWGQPPFTLLYTGPALELEWLAGVLRQGLGLSIRRGPTGAEIVTTPRGPSPVVRPRDAAEPDLGIWIFAALLGAVCVSMVWTVFHSRDLMADPAWLLFNALPCAVSGAAVGIGCVAFSRVRPRREVRRLAAVSRSMNLAFQPHASREDLGDYFYLRLFRRWSSARNRMTGTVNGVPVDMSDCTFSDRYGRGTVVLLPAPGSGLPPFDLRPRGFFDRVFAPGLAGGTGAMVEPYKGQPPSVRKCHERFGLRYELRRYYLSDHFEEAAAWAALKGRDHADNGLDPDRAGTEQEIRRFFNPDLLHFFADHPGWCVESDGAHLALWHPRTTIRAAQRPRFVAEALEVYGALARSGSLGAPRRSPAVQETEIRQA